MEILVVGGAGFIGSNLSHYFASKGDDVVIFDNLSRKGSEKNLEWLRANHKNLTFINGDIRNFDSVSKAVKGADTIFHTAAQVAVTTSVKNPREDFDINAMGTFNVLEAARQSGSDPSLVYYSTNKVYGNNVNNVRLKEGSVRYEFADPEFSNGISENFPTDANEHTPYGCSKYTADLYTRDYAAVHGMKNVTFRMSCIYGTRQFGNEDQGWVAHFIISSLLGKPLMLYGDGKQVRDILFVEDLVKLSESVVSNIAKTKGQVFNVGGGIKNTVSLLELVKLLEEINHKELLVSFGDWRPFDQKVYISDISKIRGTVGWEPKVSVKDGLKKLITWVSINKELFV
jgi:CDP-paratose 2-epimerase